MYSQFLYIIIALLLFSMQQPGKVASLSPVATGLFGLAIFGFFVLTCRWAFQRLKVATLFGTSQTSLSFRYQRLYSWFSIMALVCLGFDVYVLNIKYYLQDLPGFEESLTFSGIIGVALYFTHLLVIWLCSHPVHQLMHRSSISLAAFLKAHFTFSSALLLPWVLISVVYDVILYAKPVPYLDTSVGQVVTMGTLLAVVMLFAPWLMVRMWGCETIPAGPVRSELEQFCRHHRFRVGDLMLWPLFGGEMLTAGIVGILPQLRYILITRGLLSLLTIDELKAVVAHEMGHIRRFHLLFYFLFFICYSAVVYSVNDLLLLLLLRQDIFMGWAMATDNFHLTLFSLVYSTPIIVLLVVYFRFIFGFFLRSSERQADIYAMRLIGDPSGLISSLGKIAMFSGQIEDLPSWHHYSIRQRIDFLRASHLDGNLINRHDRRLYGWALVFMIAVLALFAVNTTVSNTTTVKQWRTDLEMSSIEHSLRLEPGNPGLLAAYGGMLLDAHRIREAESTLRKALALAPDNARILNNLAWLYATSPPPFLNPGVALELASKAVQIDPDPSIMDTLAESQYVNGHYQEAIDTIEAAMVKRPKNQRSYFVKQKAKFEKALQWSLQRAR